MSVRPVAVVGGPSRAVVARSWATIAAARALPAARSRASCRARSAGQNDAGRRRRRLRAHRREVARRAAPASRRRRAAARRHAAGSRARRTSKISSTSWAVGSTTRKPRLRAIVDQPGLGQAQQRLAHRAARDAEQLGELVDRVRRRPRTSSPAATPSRTARGDRVGERRRPSGEGRTRSGMSNMLLMASRTRRAARPDRAPGSRCAPTRAPWRCTPPTPRSTGSPPLAVVRPRHVDEVAAALARGPRARRAADLARRRHVGRRQRRGPRRSSSTSPATSTGCSRSTPRRAPRSSSRAPCTPCCRRPPPRTACGSGPTPRRTRAAPIGGMIGNNACGSRSLAYGRTSDNVAGLRLLTAAGDDARHRLRRRRRADRRGRRRARASPACAT